MQTTTQVALRRLLHFAAVWDLTYKSSVVQAIGRSESLIDSLQKIGSIVDHDVEAMANAFAHRIPVVNLEEISIDHETLVRICDPTKVPNANYAAVMQFGQQIWVVTDKPAAPAFRQKLRDLLKDYVPVIVTAKRESIELVAEEARAMVRRPQASKPAPVSIPATTTDISSITKDVEQPRVFFPTKAPSKPTIQQAGAADVLERKTWAPKHKDPEPQIEPETQREPELEREPEVAPEPAPELEGSPESVRGAEGVSHEAVQPEPEQVGPDVVEEAEQEPNVNGREDGEVTEEVTEEITHQPPVEEVEEQEYQNLPATRPERDVEAHAPRVRLDTTRQISKPMRVRVDSTPFAGFSDAVKTKLEEVFRKLDRECATSGKESVQVLASLAYGLGGSALHFAPSEAGDNYAYVTIRLATGVIELGKIKMSNYMTLMGIIRELHGLSSDLLKPPFSGTALIRYIIDGVRMFLESSCQIMPCGTKGAFETSTLTLRASGLPTLAELYPEDDRLSILEGWVTAPGLTIIGSPTLDVRRLSMTGLVASFNPRTYRVGLADLPSGDFVKFALPNPLVSQDLIKSSELDFDTMIFGDVTLDMLPTFAKLGAAGKPIIVGISAASISQLFGQVVDVLGKDVAATTVNGLAFLQPIPMLCDQCSRDHAIVGCESCKHTGILGETKLLDIWEWDARVKSEVSRTGDFLKAYSNMQVVEDFVKALYGDGRITREWAFSLFRSYNSLLQ